MASVSSQTQVLAVAVATQLLAANGARTNGYIWNSGKGNLYVSRGGIPTLTVYDDVIAPGLMLDLGAYQGAVTGIWSVAGGEANITEVTGDGAPGAGTPSVLAPWVAASDLIAVAGVDMVSMANWASEILYHLSGRRYGLKQAVVRPTQLVPTCGCEPGIRAVGSTFVGDLLRGYGCDCIGEQWMMLHGPVQAINAVKIDGTLLVPGVDYAVYDSRKLVRMANPTTGITLRWPCCQRLDLPDTAPGTWSVDYAWGQPVPVGGFNAAKELGHQLALLESVQFDAAFEDRVTELQRQGVTIKIDDPEEFFKVGRTGLYRVDLWLNSVNPRGLRRRGRIASPEMMRGVRSS